MFALILRIDESDTIFCEQHGNSILRIGQMSSSLISLANWTKKQIKFSIKNVHIK